MRSDGFVHIFTIDLQVVSSCESQHIFTTDFSDFRADQEHVALIAHRGLLLKLYILKVIVHKTGILPGRVTSRHIFCYLLKWYAVLGDLMIFHHSRFN